MVLALHRFRIQMRPSRKLQTNLDTSITKDNTKQHSSKQNVARASPQRQSHGKLTAAHCSPCEEALMRSLFAIVGCSAALTYASVCAAVDKLQDFGVN